MEKEHRDVLTKNTRKINGSLNVSDTVKDALLEEGIITQDNGAAIEKLSPKDQPGLLLRLLVRGGSNAWNVFLKALDESEGAGNRELAVTLRSSLEEYRRDKKQGKLYTFY